MLVLLAFLNFCQQTIKLPKQLTQVNLFIQALQHNKMEKLKTIAEIFINKCILSKLSATHCEMNLLPQKLTQRSDTETQYFLLKRTMWQSSLLGLYNRGGTKVHNSINKDYCGKFKTIQWGQKNILNGFNLFISDEFCFSLKKHTGTCGHMWPSKGLIWLYCTCEKILHSLSQATYQHQLCFLYTVYIFFKYRMTSLGKFICQR